VTKQELVAENRVAIDQLTFGEKTDSPDATSLPVPFIVALLKDRSGRIDIDLPIRGDLKDPDFKIRESRHLDLAEHSRKNRRFAVFSHGQAHSGRGEGEELQFIEIRPWSRYDFHF